MVPSRCLLALAAFVAAAAPTRAQNLLANGDFESDSAGWALSINNTAAAGAATASFHSTAAAHSGTYGALVQVTTAQASDNNWYIQLSVPVGGITLNPNRSYKLTYWVKSTISKTMYGAFQVKIDSTSYQNLTLSAGWTQGQAQAATGATVPAGGLTINISLGSDTGTYMFDDFVLQDMGPSVGPQSISFQAQPAWNTGIYRDLFVEYGYSKANSDAKVNSAFQQLFFGDSATQRLYFLVPGDTTMAFIDAVDAKDIRTEGMSYGMMMAVQMNRQDVFNKLWKFAKNKMQYTSGQYAGYFAWQLYDAIQTGNAPFGIKGEGPASDGEEYFVTSLFMADKRWGSASGTSNYLNYKQQADSILYYMLPGHATKGAMIDTVRKEIMFVPAAGFTDPSYHLPAFYRIWAVCSSHDTALWSKMADSSAAFLRRCSKNSTQGIMPDYANYDGTPAQASYADVKAAGSNGALAYRYDTVYASDAHRTPMNIGAYWNWFQRDTNAFAETDRFLAFLRSQGAPAKYNQAYTIDGLHLADTTWTPGESQVGCNAAGVLASKDTANWSYVRAAFDQAIPAGQYRYYNGMVYMLALLHITGNFKAWGSPGMVAMAGVQPKLARTSPLHTSLRGRELSLSGLDGTAVRLLDLRGHVAASASVVGQGARLIVPGSGLWIVEAGKARTSIAVP